MSDAEKRLREWMRTHAGAAWLPELDAMLAEHRAEVETLKLNLADAQKDAAENADALAQALQDGARAVLGGEGVETIRSRARAEALEEAARSWEGFVGAERPTGAQIAARIRALIITPAPATIPVERVREVLSQDPTYGQAPACMSNSESSAWEDGWAAANRHAAERLGVDLDAKGEKRPANLARCGCGCCAFSHRNNVGPCIINGCECSGFLAAPVTP